MRRREKLALGLLLSSVALGAAGDALFHSQPLGLNVLLWTLAFVATLGALLRLGRVPLHQGRRWMLAPLVLFAACFAWRSSPLLAATNLLALAGAVTLGALRRPDRAGVADYVDGLLRASYAACTSAAVVGREVPWRSAAGGMRGGRASAVARGVALAVPLVAVFGGLFAAADAVFASFASDLVPSLERPWAHLALGGAFAWGSAGLLRDLVAPRRRARIEAGRVLGTTEALVALAVVDLLFLSFVLVQLRYLFGGRDLVLARAHLTYAQYARHGFFELVAVAVLVLPLLLAADALVRRDDPRRVRLVRLFSAALVALVVVVIASALQRMRLYQRVYGLTELRIYTTGVMLWLAVVFAWLCATTLRGRGRFAVGAVVSGFVATGVLAVLNPDALIARTNLSRPHVDVQYLASLGDDAVPTLVERLPSLRPGLRRELEAALLARRRSGDWRSWSLSRSRAGGALERLPHPGP